MKKETLEKSQNQQQETKALLQSVHCNYLPVSNVKKATEWYVKYFGVKLLNPDGGILVLGNGQWLFLLESKTKPNGNFYTDQWDGENYEMFSLTFEVGNIVKLHQTLRESGVEVGALTDNGGCGLQFVFKDPDCNKFNAWQNNLSL